MAGEFSVNILVLPRHRNPATIETKMKPDNHDVATGAIRMNGLRLIGRKQ